MLIGAILAHLDFLDEQIERLSDAIEEQLRPFQPAVELLRSLGGIETRSAQNIIAEIGPDMSIFPTAGHLCSWAKQCPGNNQSAGKRKSGRTPKGPSGSTTHSRTSAMAAIRTNDSYLQAQYKRLKPRLGHGRALGAVKHSIICAIWHMLTTGELYHDLGGDYFRKRDPERQTKRLDRPARTPRPQSHPRTPPGGRLPNGNPPKRCRTSTLNHGSRAPNSIFPAVTLLVVALLVSRAAVRRLLSDTATAA